MNTRIFDAFSARQHQVTEYMAGCGMKYGMDCTCGPGCRCKNCPIHNEGQQQVAQPQLKFSSSTSSATSLGMLTPTDYEQVRVEQPMTFSSFGMSPPTTVQHPTAPAINNFSFNDASQQQHQQQNNQNLFVHYENEGDQQQNQQNQQHQQHRPSTSRAQRNPSVLSYGHRGSVRDGQRASLRGMSITSETTFGRAMSGLSALSIDWENLDDFDLEVDHSAHINGHPNAAAGGARRASATRRSFLSSSSQEGASNTSGVSFKVQ